jgi:hypothetical protein
MITLSGIVELMLSRVLSRLSLVRVTVGYAAILIVVATTLLILGPRVEDAVVSHMSTNVHNLARGHFATLVGSVFVTSSGFIYVWLPGLICLLALAELFWRGGRLILAFGLGHVGATLSVGVGLAAAIRFGPRIMPWCSPMADDGVVRSSLLVSRMDRRTARLDQEGCGWC